MHHRAFVAAMTLDDTGAFTVAWSPRRALSVIT
jgi:hypothetical protein